MTQQKEIPDPEKVKHIVKQLRESSRQLELVTWALDELIARVDAELHRQRQARLQSSQHPNS